MRKEGISHIEVVLAFVIFATAIGFALYFFNPAKDTSLVEPSLDYSFREITKNSSVEIESYSVRIESSAENPVGIEIGGVDSEKMQPRVKDLSGIVLKAGWQGGLICVERNGANFVTISFSEEFEGDDISGCTDNLDYELAASNEVDVLSEKKITELKEFYDEYYFELRKQFNLPSRVNWGFELKFDNEAPIVADIGIPGGYEVFSDTRRVEILRESKEIEFADLTVKVW